MKKIIMICSVVLALVVLSGCAAGGFFDGTYDVTIKAEGHADSTFPWIVTKGQIAGNLIIRPETGNALADLSNVINLVVKGKITDEGKLEASLQDLEEGDAGSISGKIVNGVLSGDWEAKEAGTKGTFEGKKK